MSFLLFLVLNIEYEISFLNKRLSCNRRKMDEKEV